MKFSTLLLAFLSLLHGAHAEDVYLKTGKVVRASSLRRDGTVAFAKLLTPPEETSLIAINQIERIVFTEAPEMREASAAAYAGDAQTVLIKTAAPLAYHNQWHDVPGNARGAILRLVLPALVNTRKTAELKTLLQTWVPTGDPDLEATVQLLKLRLLNPDKTAFEKAAVSATSTCPGTLSAAVAWIEQGNTYLSTGQWAKAARAFLSVRLFSPGWRLLQAPALLGAVEACRGNDQIPESLPLIEDLQTEYPGSQQTRTANALPKLKATTTTR
jgi:hypothetical protein